MHSHRYVLTILSIIAFSLPAFGQSGASFGSIVAELGSRCLDVAGARTAVNADVIQYDCHGRANQQLQFLNSGEVGHYRVQLQHSNLCLSPRDGSDEENTDIVQVTCSDDDSLIWEVSGDGAYKQLKNQSSQLCIGLEGATSQNEGDIIQTACTNSGTFFALNGAIRFGVIRNSQWSRIYELPLVPVAAANLSDGRILTWSAYAKLTFGGRRGYTATSIFDPATGEATDRQVSETNHDMFCPGTAQLSDGTIMVTGGSNAGRVSFYDSLNDDWYAGPALKIARGYHSMTVLGDGSVFTVGGSWSGPEGGKNGELWTPDTNWTLLDTIETDSQLNTNDRQGVYRSDNHMWLFTAPNGDVFHAGPSPEMHWIDVDAATGDEGIVDAPFRGTDSDGDGDVDADDDVDGDAMNGNAVMYDVGLIMTNGGAPHYAGRRNNQATDHAYVIDVTGGRGNVEVQATGNMNYIRTLQNSVVLPSGEVVVVGGQQRPALFTDELAAYHAEIWSPETGEFTVLAEMQVPRTYHSVALLLQDGRVISGGGGLCQNDCNTNHPDVEILTPPYLLNNDGTPATRPVIEDAPESVEPGARVNVTLNSESAHTFALVRFGIATHAVDNDQRRIPLVSEPLGAGQFSVRIPNNPSVVLPGNYFLFAMNAAGTPSVATVVNVPGDAVFQPLKFGTMVSERLSGLCVDINRAGQADGQTVGQWTCNGGDHQLFAFEESAEDSGAYHIIAAHSNKCLGVEGASTDNIADVVQLPCDAGDHVLWRVGGAGNRQTLTNQNSDKCLDVFEASTERGTRLIQFDCQNSINQHWRINGTVGE